MLNKSLIGKLPVEQQEILAQMELRKTQRRLKLLETARGLDWRTRYFPLAVFGSFLFFLAAYYFNLFHVQAQPSVTYLPIGVGMVFMLFANNTRTNRRLDALLELLDHDREERESAAPPNAD